MLDGDLTCFSILAVIQYLNMLKPRTTGPVLAVLGCHGFHSWRVMTFISKKHPKRPLPPKLSFTYVSDSPIMYVPVSSFSGSVLPLLFLSFFLSLLFCPSYSFLCLQLSRHSRSKVTQR